MGSVPKGKALVHSAPGTNTRVSGFAMGDRKYLGKDEEPTVGLESWSDMDEDTMRLRQYSAIGITPAHARIIAQQLNTMADYADGLIDNLPEGSA